MNEQVTAFINEAPPEQQQIMQQLRQLLHDSVADVQEDFKARLVRKGFKDVIVPKRHEEFGLK